jgi:hypothetical protein
MKTKTEEQIILPTDENIIKWVENISGWVDNKGRFWGNNKDMAIYNSITHKRCDCGELMTKGYTKCPKCINKAKIEAYNKLPFEEWDGKSYIYSHYADQYFCHLSDIEDYCNDNNVKSEDLRLVLCVGNYIEEIDGSQWEELLPEDHDYFPKIVQQAIDEFNAKVKDFPPLSWAPSKTRTTIHVKLEIE